MTLNPRNPTPKGFENYQRCIRCGVDRPESALGLDGLKSWSCTDVPWCSKQGKPPTGLDVNGDALPVTP